MVLFSFTFCLLCIFPSLLCLSLKQVEKKYKIHCEQVKVQWNAIQSKYDKYVLWVFFHRKFSFFFLLIVCVCVLNLLIMLCANASIQASSFFSYRFGMEKRKNMIRHSFALFYRSTEHTGTHTHYHKIHFFSFVVSSKNERNTSADWNVCECVKEREIVSLHHHIV